MSPYAIFNFWYNHLHLFGVSGKFILSWKNFIMLPHIIHAMCASEQDCSGCPYALFYYYVCVLKKLKPSKLEIIFTSNLMLF